MIPTRTHHIDSGRPRLANRPTLCDGIDGYLGPQVALSYCSAGAIKCHVRGQAAILWVTRFLESNGYRVVISGLPDDLSGLRTPRSEDALVNCQAHITVRAK